MLCVHTKKKGLYTSLPDFFKTPKYLDQYWPTQNLCCKITYIASMVLSTITQLITLQVLPWEKGVFGLEYLIPKVL